MENSAKALLISATVLIVLLLIGVGMRLFNSTTPLYDEVSMSEQTREAKTFNSEFLAYFGNSVSPARTRDFIKKVMKHNIQVNPDSSNFSAELHQIYLLLYKKNSDPVISGGGHKWTTADLNQLYNNILDNQTYQIRMTNQCGEPGVSGGYYKGYLLCITIQENNPR